MDNSLQVFHYNGNDVRTVEIDGEAWFVGEDIADILGYQDIIQAIKDLVSNKNKMTWQIASLGQESNITIINENGVYSLIAFSENFPTTKEFKQWFTSDVLPAIRKSSKSSSNKEQQALPYGVIEGAKIILEVAGLKDKQLAFALDKLYRSYTGKSALAFSNLLLETLTEKQ